MNLKERIIRNENLKSIIKEITEYLNLKLSKNDVEIEEIAYFILTLKKY